MVFLREMLKGRAFAGAEKPDLVLSLPALCAPCRGRDRSRCHSSCARRVMDGAVEAPRLPCRSLQTWPWKTHQNKSPVLCVLRVGNAVASALAEDKLGKQPFVMFLALKNDISYIKNTLAGAVTCIEKFHP